MLTLLSLTCINGYDRTGGPIWNYAIGSLTPLKGPGTLLNRVALSNANVGKYAPMQAVKQPACERAWNNEK